LGESRKTNNVGICRGLNFKEMSTMKAAGPEKLQDEFLSTRTDNYLKKLLRHLGGANLHGLHGRMGTKERSHPNMGEK